MTIDKPIATSIAGEPANKICIYSIGNNFHSKRKRRPLVQMIAVRSSDDPKSICLAPSEAEMVAKELRRAAKRARMGSRYNREIIMPLEDL